MAALLAKEAQRFYQNGVPVLQRHLPFGVANLIDRMWPVVVSILAMLLPFTRVSVPLSYNDELYALGSHIALVRTRLSDAAGATLTPPPARSPA